MIAPAFVGILFKVFIFWLQSCWATASLPEILFPLPSEFELMDVSLGAFTVKEQSNAE